MIVYQRVSQSPRLGTRCLRRGRWGATGAAWAPNPPAVFFSAMAKGGWSYSGEKWFIKWCIWIHEQGMMIVVLSIIHCGSYSASIPVFLLSSLWYLMIMCIYLMKKGWCVSMIFASSGSRGRQNDTGFATVRTADVLCMPCYENGVHNTYYHEIVFFKCILDNHRIFMNIWYQLILCV